MLENRSSANPPRPARRLFGQWPIGRRSLGRRVWRAGAALALLPLLALGAGRLAFGQAADSGAHPVPAAPGAPVAPATPVAPNPPAQPTPAPVVQSNDVPLELDPNDPTASKEERLRRQRAVIEQRIQQRRERDAAKKAQPTPTPKPTPAPVKPGQPAQPGVAPPAQPPNKKGGKGGSALFSEKALPPHVTIFIKAERDRAVVGQPFTTTCAVDNPSHLSLDAVELLLSYPARNLKLTAVHQDKLRPLLDGDPQFVADPENGTVVYRARLKEPFKALELPVVTLVWEPIAPANAVQITPHINHYYSSASSKGVNLALSLMGQASAVTGVTLNILPGAKAARTEMMAGGAAITPDFDAMQLTLNGFKDQTRLRPPSLWLAQPENETLEPGRVVMIDLGVNNPDHIVFDEIRAAAQYDPAAVEVLDNDKANWISDGINLLDGPFHKAWPWDRHFANRVDPQRGLFYYHTGMTNLREQPSGAFARVFVRIKKPVQAPIFTWIWREDADPGEPTTGIYLFNRNLYLKGHPQETSLDDLTADGERANPSVYEF